MLQAASPTPATILVVDDAPQNIKLLRVILKDAGYRVIEASSGPEALDVMRREKPDAMVLDVRMPGMTGYDVCREVREDPEFATLPVIMLTALSQPEERVMGIEAGATDFISKPFNKKELMARVQASLALTRGLPRGGSLALPAAVVIADAGWKVVAASPAAEALLGSGLVGLDASELLAGRGLSLPAGDVSNQPQQLHAETSEAVSGTHTVVTGPDGVIALRVIVLVGAAGAAQ